MVRLRGVNLGGWLVLERWITPSLFEGLKAQDETAFCLELGDKKTEILRHHRQNFITEDDFIWMAACDLNAVRIPVPHWLFGGVEPYEAAVEFMDWAMDQSRKHGLKVLLDIHTAPGSQNGRSHSGLTGQIKWHKNKKNVQVSLQFLQKLAERYGGQPNLWGIELLNEPRAWISPKVLKNFYIQGYEIVRRYCGEEVAAVISDYFAPWRWSKFMPEPAFKNVVRDSHFYQCHRPEDIKLNMEAHLNKTEGEWAESIAQKQKDKPLIIGEWSLALTAETFAELSKEQKAEALRSYGQAQLEVFTKTDGWFYWTYKTETDASWNFRHCVESHLLPGKFDSIVKT